MAKYESRPDHNLSSCVCINSYEQSEGITVYLVQVKIGNCCWVVKHRYSDFFELNEKLVVALGINGSLLPPKKLFGKHSDAFLQRRKTELEHYLRTIICLPTLSPLLADFLDFNKYEIHGITQTLAEDLFLHGDQLLVCRDFFHVTPLQLHSLAERLKLPEPTCDAGDGRKDIGHILDFFSQVRQVLVCGSNKAVGTSNIVPNNLEVDFTSLKSVERLKLDGCNPHKLQGFHSLRVSVKLLQVQESLKSLRELLLGDTLHWDPEQPPATSVWVSALQADFSYNQLTEIDHSIWLLPNLETLDLSHNQIASIDNLDHLSRLTHLNLASNCFSLLLPLHTRLGNIVSLNFAGNGVNSLLAFSKLYSLVSLDLLDNRISEVSEIAYIAGLPCLEHLTLTGNPLATMVDYRTRTLEQFNHRASELCLDHERPSQQELDTVAVLQAIRRAREGFSEQRLCMPGNSRSHRNRSGQNGLNTATPQVGRQTPQQVTDFRHQVEAIREQEGEGWLRIWNRQQKLGSRQTSHAVPPLTNDPSEHLHYATHSQDRKDQDNQNKPAFRCIVMKDFILPYWLPATNKREVTDAIKSLKIPSLLPSEQWLGCFWSLVLCFPQRMKRVTFPACIVMIPGALAIAYLKSVDCNYKYPQLVLFAHIEMDLISNLVVGQHEHFVGFEARHADSIHAYTFLFSSRKVNAYFVTLIQAASIYTVKHSLRIFQQEALQDTADMQETSSFSWVAVDVPFPMRADAVTCLVVKGTTIQLVYEQVVRLTCGKHQEPPLQVVRAWNIQRDVVDCHISVPDDAEINTLSKDSDMEDVFPELSKDLKQTLRSAGYPVTLWFWDSSLLLVRFPSLENREEFLSAFTKVRQLSNCLDL